jgi:hypothetical protein
MTDELLVLRETPSAQHMIVGWRQQWSDGGEISGGLLRYLIDHYRARRIGEMGPQISKMCYPFQVPGTHDIYRPRVAFQEGLPVRNMHRANNFFDAGNGLILFLGEEPWFRIDLYGEAFFQALKELGISQTIAVEGYNGAAPPNMERSISCIYSHARMKESLQKYGLRFSNYGSNRRSGPTIGMALVSMAHYQYSQFEVIRLGAMAPMYPFLSSGNDPVGISQDHRAFYDLMRRIKSMFKLDLSLTELLTLGESESRELEETLDGIRSSSPEARDIIDKIRSDYKFNPFVEAVELGPTLDKTLEDILRNTPGEPDGS